ncbi:GNAT family N-acetyltransferase [Listeria ilorinensis]|uniref:GNAT family N-acetyltransferase n=1 Tax=Listeria ilorinensis TaxID=2867439 RepID=UPI001EF66967|nr:GNAT family N-acetyltransferase [Listeria ilorinensis]
MRLTRYQNHLIEDIEQYYLTEEMQFYSSQPLDCIHQMLKEEAYFPILGYNVEQLVCFFVLDGGAVTRKYTLEPEALLIRSFSTDSRFMRQGHAERALLKLPEFVCQEFPTKRLITLGVNEANLAARRLYEKTGFTYTGESFLGPKGVQFVMTLDIRDETAYTKGES